MATDDYVRFKNSKDHHGMEDPSNDERSLISLDSTLERSKGNCKICVKSDVEKRKLLIVIVILIVFFIIITPVAIWLTTYIHHKDNPPQKPNAQQQTAFNGENGSNNATKGDSLNSVERKMSAYEKEQKQMLKRLENIENENTKLKRALSLCIQRENFTAEMKKLQSNIESKTSGFETGYEQTISNVTDFISDFEQDMESKLQNMTGGFMTQIQNMVQMSSTLAMQQASQIGERFNDLQTQIMGMNQRLSELQEDGTAVTGTNQTDNSCKQPIAFYVQVSENTVTAKGEVVQYTKVVTDTCNAYNRSTGIFTCTVPGVYIFHIFSLDQAKNTPNHLQLMKNGDWVAVCWSKAESGYHESTGNSAILELVEGDEVYVKAGKSHTAQLWKEYSTFSGFRLS